MSEEVGTKHRWRVQLNPDTVHEIGMAEYVSEMAWVTDSGALMIGNHVNDRWVPDAMFNVGEWATLARVEEG